MDYIKLPGPSSTVEVPNQNQNQEVEIPRGRQGLVGEGCYSQSWPSQQNNIDRDPRLMTDNEGEPPHYGMAINKTYRLTLFLSLSIPFAS